MNRTDLQELAQIRLDEALMLQANQLWDGAYYLAGYAIECALKACFAKQVNQFDFPDKAKVNSVYCHDLARLMELSGLKLIFDNACKNDTDLESNWQTVLQWEESARYERKSQAQTDALISAIIDPHHGVLPCIIQHW